MEYPLALNEKEQEVISPCVAQEYGSLDSGACCSEAKLTTLALTCVGVDVYHRRL